MCNDYTIAVLLSSYNGEKYILQQIDSILNQKLTHGQLDLYVRDDGSTDQTINILVKRREQDKRVHIIKGDNIGYIASFFNLMYLMKEQGSQYDYYSLADQDDVWDEDKLQCAVNCIEKNEGENPFLYQSTTRITDEKLNYIKKDAIQKRSITVFNTMIQTFSAGHTYVFNKNLLNSIDRDIDNKNLYGHDAYLTNLAVIRGKIYFDNVAHNDYRQHGNNQLGTNDSGLTGWLKIKLKRVIHGDGIQYTKQIKYFLELFNSDLSISEKKEIEKFLSSNSTLIHRISYAFSTKMYRQQFLETLAFKLLYIFGGYKIKKEDIKW